MATYMEEARARALAKQAQDQAESARRDQKLVARQAEREARWLRNRHGEGGS